MVCPLDLGGAQRGARKLPDTREVMRRYNAHRTSRDCVIAGRIGAIAQGDIGR